MSASHRPSTPIRATWNGASHSKKEFFDLEDFSSRGDFLAKVHTYQLYFNLVRPNSLKENLSP
jgi:hypothetical protein